MHVIRAAEWCMLSEVHWGALTKWGALGCMLCEQQRHWGQVKGSPTAKAGVASLPPAELHSVQLT